MNETGPMDETNGAGDPGEGGDSAESGPTPPPIGGVVRERPTPQRRSFMGYLGSQIAAAVVAVLTALGLRRRRNDDGTLAPRPWKRLFAIGGGLLLVLFVWTSVHVVGPGTVGIPVTLGHTGDSVGSGVRITMPLTTMHSVSVRTQNYTMSSVKGEGARGAVDDSVPVLGADGGSAQVNATVLFRVDPARATKLYREIGGDYTAKIVRPSARTCIRLEFTKADMVEAATTSWDNIETNVTKCMKRKIEPAGLVLQDFQLREIALGKQLQTAVNAKVASQQNSQRQKFELSTAQQAADIARVTALATADSQQILACGGSVQTVERDGKQVKVVVPNPVSACSQAQLTPAYLQYTYIQALKQLVNSPNNSTIILPFDQNLTPLINVGGTGSSGTPANRK